MLKIDRRTALKAMGLTALAPTWASGADPYADAVLHDGPPPPVGADAFTVVVLPDTQNYSEKHPATFAAQTRWALAQKADRRIAALVHLGDITNKNTPAEWANAQAALAPLNGQLPYFFCTGNHDYGKLGGCVDRSTGLNLALPIANYRKLSTFGGVYDREPERMDNSFGFFRAGGREFLVLALEFGPRADVIRWANDVVGRHRSHEVILITHAFVYTDNRRYDWAKLGKQQSWNPHSYPLAKSGDDVHDGQQLWDMLVSKNSNVIMTLNGHVLNSGLGRLTTPNAVGRPVPQMLVNFQMKPQGGDGWLRLLEFQPDRKTVSVIDYSPTRNQCNMSPGNRFTIATA